MPEPLDEVQLQNVLRAERSNLIAFPRRHGSAPLIQRSRSSGYHLSDAKAVLILRLLVEGMSIRAISRVLNVAKNTVMRLQRRAASWCRDFLKGIVGISSEGVECDELYTFVQRKDFSRRALSKKSHTVGSTWVYVGLDRETRFMICYHVGRRTYADAVSFMDKLKHAAPGDYTIYTDGFAAYPSAIHETFVSGRFGPDEEVIEWPIANAGKPLHFVNSIEYTKSSTNHVERLNNTIRQHMKRMARGTMAFSKTTQALDDAFALFSCYYNFCRPHLSLDNRTPAMAMKLSDKPWDMPTLIRAIQIPIVEQGYHAKFLQRYGSVQERTAN